jgi:hypothetical protein
MDEVIPGEPSYSAGREAAGSNPRHEGIDRSDCGGLTLALRGVLDGRSGLF